LRPEETISLFMPDAIYKYNVTKRTLTIEKLKTDHRRELFRYQLDRAIALCLFRVKDTRPIIIKDGKPQIAPAYWASTSSLDDPEPDKPVSVTKKITNRYKEKLERGITIADSVFDTSFPNATKITHLPDRNVAPTGWFSGFLMEANNLISDTHP
jgi:hypothetical protein